MRTDSKRAACAALATAAGLLGAVGSAQASTLSYEGDALVVRTGAGDNHINVAGRQDGTIFIGDFTEAFAPLPQQCRQVGTAAEVACEAPARRLRVELGAGNDGFGITGYTHDHVIEVIGAEGDDELFGGTRPELLDGGPGKDDLRGEGGDDVLHAGPGDDQLRGDAGNDQLHGDDGNDALYPDDGETPGADLVDGGAGDDGVIDWAETSASVLPRLAISLDGQANDGRPGERDNVIGVERSTTYVAGTFVLSDGPDVWNIWSQLGGGGPSTVHAGGGNDRIVAEAQTEAIDGGAGDDYLEAGNGDDTITGGPGRDTIFGDDTDTTCDKVVCLVAGKDVIEARDGEADSIDCGPSEDRAVVDAIDQVSNCEVVDRPGGPGPAGPGPAGAPKLALVKTRLKRALARGFKVRLTGAKPGKVTLRAKQGRKVVASGRGKVAANGQATVRLTFTKAARRALKRKRSVKLRVSGGGAALTLKLKR